MKKYDAVIAGYLCVDLIPGFQKNDSKAGIADVFRPGKLIEIEGLDFILGGAVANTGIAMKRFSKKIFLNGILGDDFIGKIARERLDNYSLSAGIKTIEGQDTAFGIVIAPPGVDRIFLESPGCSKIFDISHINYDIIAESRLFHFGYPPLLKKFYQDDGDQLVKMFRHIQGMNVVTSLDFSLPDAESESGRVNWAEVLRRVLPFTDIFVPSLEEALLIIMPDEYARIRSCQDNIDIIDKISFEMIQDLAKRIIDYGAKIVLIKAGHRGAYLRTGDISSINKKPGIRLSEESWNRRDLWCEACPVDAAKFKNASGAGDTSAAAFLVSILDSEDPESSLKYATVAGRNNLYCNDLYEDLIGWEEMAREIESVRGLGIDLTQRKNNN